MMRRNKEAGGPPNQPGTPWLAGATIGLTIMTMAAGAMMVLGAGMALGPGGAHQSVALAVAPEDIGRDFID